MKRRLKNAAGFTLVELIVVIAILGILAGVAVPTYSGYVKKANLAADQTVLDSINMAFAAACIENQVDINKLDPLPTLKIDDSTGALDVNGSDLVNENVEAAVGRYLGGEVKFKIVKNGEALFNPLSHMFEIDSESVNVRAAALKYTWTTNGNSFFKESDGGAAAAKKLDGTLGGISTIFTGELAKGEITPDAWLPGFSADFYAAFGFTDMLDGINGAMAGKTGVAAGDAAVLYFAESAKNCSAADLQNSVNNFLTVLSAEMPTGISKDTFEAQYYEGLSTDMKGKYDAAVRSGAKTIDQFLSETNGGLFSYGNIIAMEAAAKTSGGNSAGINSLGAMYALAAGYFEKTGATAYSTPGTFNHVLEAMTKTDFENYYTTQGAADLDAYRSFMGYLATGDFELGETSLFGDGTSTGKAYEHISGALGFDS